MGRYLLEQAQGSLLAHVYSTRACMLLYSSGCVRRLCPDASQLELYWQLTPPHAAVDVKAGEHC